MKRTAIAIAVGALSAGLSHGLLAQETQDEETQPLNEQQQMQDQSSQTQSGSGSAEINVEEEPADVNVDQEPAEVQVQQEPPDVTVEQNPPEVTIEQQDPNVSVDQAEPEVTVEKEGEPNVEVQEAEDAEAKLKDSDEEQQQQDQQSQEQQNSEQASQENDLMSMEVSELQGKTVYSQEDEKEIGDVERVVRDTESNEAFVVISEGGFLGFGEDEMGYPVDELEIRNENELVVQSGDSGESGDYGSDQYEEIDGNQTLREAMQSN
ncbi:PRC-barrel domain-containing protein [Billgrantia bachuensis]|uniref:PRC-barrel domain containing protein n=1 Tax=Billgrantia bachuensis TaxID=2717286 RepID=A0ABX0PQF4_9GAMM|nr:PRC-barrel domain-containing protein [Halomonas bachuensis]NIC05572.1 PRC-barrel domain containing protein [Halomonas bachuensis]